MLLYKCFKGKGNLESLFPFLCCRDAGHKCPVDNEILLENQLFPDNFAKREILSLTVKCPNKGCSMKMELRHLEVRISSENTEPFFHGQVKVQNNLT